MCYDKKYYHTEIILYIYITLYRSFEPSNITRLMRICTTDYTPIRGCACAKIHSTFPWAPLFPAVFLGNQTYFLVKTRLFLRSTLSCLPGSKRWAICFITLLTSAKKILIVLPRNSKCKQTWQTTTGQCQPETVHSYVSITSVIWWWHSPGLGIYNI